MKATIKLIAFVIGGSRCDANDKIKTANIGSYMFVAAYTPGSAE